MRFVFFFKLGRQHSSNRRRSEGGCALNRKAAVPLRPLCIHHRCQHTTRRPKMCLSRITNRLKTSTVVLQRLKSSGGHDVLQHRTPWLKIVLSPVKNVASCKHHYIHSLLAWRGGAMGRTVD